VTVCQKIRWLLVLTATCVLPAYANNPPQPDGVLSVLLIFPIVLLGMRLTVATLGPKTAKRRLLIGLPLALCFIMTLAGTEIGLLGLLVILVYGIVRGIQIMRRGQGWKPHVVGVIVVLWAVFAVGDYYASITAFPSSIALGESLAVQRLRTLSIAETNFVKGSSRSEAVYGTIADLVQARFLGTSFVGGQVHMGYRFDEIVEQPKRQFLFYALPVPTQSSQPRWWRLLPGASLTSASRGHEEEQATGIRSFAVDETGIIRYAIRTVAGPVTREEFMKWEELQ
jgi:hypothetical protein